MQEGENGDGTYFPNLPQISKFKKAIDLSKEYAKNSLGCSVKVEPVNEADLHGYFCITAPTLYVHGKELVLIRKIQNLVDVVCIFCTADEKMTMEFNVNNIYIKQDV